MQQAASGYYEPTLTHQLLPGCPCGSPHPIALRSPDQTICPQCGTPAQPPRAAVTEPAVLVGMPHAKLMLWLGRKFAALAARIRNG